MHTQMYMLEGGSRWNMNRAHAAVDVSGASNTKIYDVRLMSNLNALSNRVLGCALLPEFTPPGRPTDERVAVEYLLAQSDRGDLLGPQRHGELGLILPDLQVQVQEEECLDITISDAAEILNESPPEAPRCEDEVDNSPPHRPLPHDNSPNTSSQDSQCDVRGVPGWEAVDNLAEYLVNLNRTITALSTAEVAEIVRLYSSLDAMDKSPSKYTLKCKKKTLTGPWRASRKRSGSAPGQQAAERLFMTHGQAAQRPDMNRVSECVNIKLLKEYQQARNRPKDCKGKTLPIPQSIVQTYCHIKQLLEDSRVIQDQTNLVLVTINNTTVSSWLHQRQKRADRDSLLKEVQLPQVSAARESLPKARELPSAPGEHGHLVMEFQEPENKEGQAVIRRRQSVKTGCPPRLLPGSSASSSSYEQGPLPPAPSPSPASSSYDQGPLPPAPSPSPSPASSSYKQGPLPPAPSPSPSPASSSYEQGPLPPAPSPSPASSSYDQGPLPPAPSPSPASSSYEQGPLPPAPSSSPASSSYEQGPLPPAPSPSPASSSYDQGPLPPAPSPSPASSSYDQGPLPPAPSPSPASSSYDQGPLPPAPSPSPASSSYDQGPLPPAPSPSPASSSYDQGPLPPAPSPSPASSSYDQGPLPPAPSPASSSYDQGHLAPAPTPASSLYWQSPPPPASTPASSSWQCPPPPAPTPASSSSWQKSPSTSLYSCIIILAVSPSTRPYSCLIIILAESPSTSPYSCLMVLAESPSTSLYSCIIILAVSPSTSPYSCLIIILAESPSTSPYS
ncbi:formin-like protein 5 [Sebastes umbrosus]|uniref:formin-like protein 5 n=1 Tax=Sebastes umbrosus TaxID=72105 RepID=UPI00189EEA04|nr:formin-like protein 5 [Sebastes umbrosus]